MKYLLYTFTLLIFFYLFSCGNDTTTNTGNGNGNETVIFSLDSLSINLNISASTNDTIVLINNSPNIKITFNCTTNVDSVNSFALYRITAADSTNFYKDTINNNISELNGDHIININASSSYTIKVLLQISRNIPNPYFIRLKNIKVIKL